MAEGRAFAAFLAMIDKTATRASFRPGLESFAKELSAARQSLADVTLHLHRRRAEQGNAAVLAKASVYLDLVGVLTFAWIWLEQASVAAANLPQTSGIDQNFRNGLIQTCGYVFRHVLPGYQQLAALLMSNDDSILAMRDEWFGGGT